MNISFGNLVVVSVAAFFTPLVLGFFPRLRVPSVVAELIVGILLGPAVLDVLHEDEVVRVVATLGLAFLLFIAGLEMDFESLKGETFRLATAGFAVSFVAALALGIGLYAANVILTPLLIAIVLSSTSLGVVIAVLKDSHQLATPFGQLVVAGSSVAEFGTVALLSIFYSVGGGSVASHAALLLVLAAVAVAVLWGMVRLYHVMPYVSVLRRLRDTTAEIRVRAAVMLMLGAVVLATNLGFEAILGAFMAGALLSVLHHGWEDEPELFHTKMDAIGFGFFVPVFFVSAGINLEVGAVFGSPAAIVRVFVFLAAMLVVRGGAARIYRRRVGPLWVPAGLLQATSLSFTIVAVQVGTELHKIRPENGAALILAGLLSLLIYPPAALSILRRQAEPSAASS